MERIRFRGRARRRKNIAVIVFRQICRQNVKKLQRLLCIPKASEKIAGESLESEATALGKYETGEEETARLKVPSKKYAYSGA